MATATKSQESSHAAVEIESPAKGFSDQWFSSRLASRFLELIADRRLYSIASFTNHRENVSLSVCCTVRRFSSSKPNRSQSAVQQSSKQAASSTKYTIRSLHCTCVNGEDK